MRSSMLSRTLLLKPAAVAATRYLPESSSGTTYLPSAFVRALITTLVARFRTSTSEDGTSAPEGSRTSPEMVARVSWPDEGCTLRNTMATVVIATKYLKTFDVGINVDSWRLLGASVPADSST